MQYNITHDIHYSFWDSPENSKKLTEKAHFVVGFEMFFDHDLFRFMGNAPIFGQMKALMEVHNHGKFHRYSIYGC